jgi:hypothetical protein
VTLASTVRSSDFLPFPATARLALLLLAQLRLLNAPPAVRAHINRSRVRERVSYAALVCIARALV